MPSQANANVGTNDIGSGKEGVYATSFGDLPNETAYYSPELKADMRPEINKAMEPMLASLKAHTTTSGGPGTAGYAMVPVYVDPLLVDRTRKQTPLVELIRRVTNKGMTADYNVITEKGGGFTAAEDSGFGEKDNTYDRQSEPIKSLYAVGRVTGQSQAAQPSFTVGGLTPQAGNAYGTFSDAVAPNAMQLEVLIAARAIKEMEEDLIINGNKTTSYAYGPNGTEFDGIIQLQGTTNQLDLSGAALTWDDIEEVTQYAFDDGGHLSLAIAASNVVVQIRKIMIDVFRMGPQDIQASGLVFGIPQAIQIDTVAGRVTVLPSRFMTNTSGSKQIYFLDMDYIEVRVLLDMTYEKLAKTNDSEKFMLKMYECFIMRAPQFNSFITNIE